MEFHKIKLLTNEYLEFKNSYDFETENGYSHFVNGNIFCHPNDMNKVYNITFS